MAGPVPAAERLSAPPAWALARVPGLERGEAPDRLVRLEGGSVNEVFGVDSRCGQFVLRLDGAAWRRPGVERQRELTLHRAAAAAGIAPGIVYAEPAAQGLLISEFHHGRQWDARDFENLPSLRRLGERLQALHALSPPPIAAFDPWQVALDYLQQIATAPPSGLERRALDEPLARLQRSCAALADSAGACIVHGDLAQSNLLEGSRLWLLDWEYAQRSDALMDVACVLAYHPAARRHGAELTAAAGLGSQARGEALMQRVYIYQALAWLWHLARGESTPAP